MRRQRRSVDRLVTNELARDLNLEPLLTTGL